jgi:TPR repeat protein
MKKDDELTESNSLIPSSGQALARRSGALVVRGIRDLEATERAYAEAESERGAEYEVAEKFADAAIHYRNAAELGHAGAQFRLAEMYKGGKGVEQSLQEAQIWFGRIREAAERGESEAQFSLALMFSGGLGVEQDDAEAAKWMRRAAEQGDAYAAVHLAICYDSGLGVSEDHEEGERWLLKAVARGNPLACYFLGLNCLEAEDFVRAYMWFELGAIKGGVEPGKLLCKMWRYPDDGKEQCKMWRYFIEGRLSASQIAEAERLAREWEATVDKAQSRSSTDGTPIQADWA